MILINQILVNSMLSQFYKHATEIGEGSIHNLKSAELFYDYLGDKLSIPDNVKKELWLKSKRMYKYRFANISQYPDDYKKKCLHSLYKSIMLEYFLNKEFEQDRVYMFDNVPNEIKIKNISVIS
jgi:hypothetical protein